MADNDFASEAAKLAIADLERDLVTASRLYEDSVRDGDTASAALAMREFASRQAEYNSLTGANEPRQPGLSTAQANFLSRRSAGGDELSPQRLEDYGRGHHKALAAGWAENSPEYFRAVEGYVDSLGDGRSRPLDEREAAKLCGLTDQEYSANADRLAALKRDGHYQD